MGGISLSTVILAAGKGKRLWPLTTTRPKPLLPLPGGYIISRIIDAVYEISSKIVVVAGHYSWMIRKLVEERYGPKVVVVEQEEQLGTGHAALIGLKSLSSRAGKIMVVYGDLYFDTSILRKLAEKEPPVIAGVMHTEPSRYGVLYEKEGCLSRIVEKPRDAPSPSPINAGIYLLSGDAVSYLEKIRPSVRGEYELTDALTLMARETCVRVLRVEGDWLDVGLPWEYLRSVRIELGKKLSRSKIDGDVEPGVVLRGPVYVSEKAVIRSGSVVEGPAWVEGEVGPLSHIRPYTFLAKESFVGAFSQVKASVVMEYAKVPHLNYVGDSIVGEKVNLGAGTITANLRFDKKTVRTLIRGELVDTGLKKYGAVIGGYAQTGINVSLMPGVKVGAFSWIEPGSVVRRDVPDCTFYREKGPAGLKDVDCTPRKTPWEE